MKAYIIYIATLLAALALPAAAQTGSTDTKAAPADPVMPYKLSLVTTYHNNGTVTVEDNTPGGGGIVVAGNDTLVYGASGGTNATTVKLTVTPNNGYVVRTGYPKAYKTGATGTKVTITGNSSPYTLTMPAYPVTVEVAYATPIEDIDVITLKEKAVDFRAAIALLPQEVSVTLANGSKSKLVVSVWEYTHTDNNGENGAYDNNNADDQDGYNTTPGAVNLFRFTLANALPGSLDANNQLTEADDGTYTGKVFVANMAEPLAPEGTGNSLIISGGTGDNLNSKTDENGTPTPFNGTIGKDDGTATEVKSIAVSGDVKDATLTLKGVTVTGGTSDPSTDAKTEIKGGADVTLKLEGTNALGTLTVENGASITLKPEAGATLNVTKIENAGTFIDSTATITKVEGTGALDINANLTGGGSVTTNTAVTLTSTVNDRAGTTSFIWQRKQADGSYTDIITNQYDQNGALVTTKAATGITDTYTPPTNAVGTAEYRCLVKRVVNNSGTGSTPAITLLSTKSATVEVKSGSTPPPPVPVPNYYTVTLPSVEGFTTKPGAGNHTVEEGYSFRFSLILPEGYTGDAPAVTTSRGETLEPRESDGKYIIRNVTEDITVEIAGLPTANIETTADGIRIECHAGSVHIHTPQPVATAIYTLAGYRLRQLSLPAGDHRIGLPQGAYVIVAGDKRQKLVIR